MLLRELVLALVIATLVTACAATRLYDGVKLPAEKVVRIHAEFPAKIAQIDGAEVDGRMFEILPGRHSLHLMAERTIRGSLIPLSLTATCSAALDLAAGQHYVVRSRFDRKRYDKPKAPYGSVTRYELTLDLGIAGDSVAPPALPCPDQEVCLILWKHGRYNQTATCSQYDNPKFSFRSPDSDKAVPAATLDLDHCERLDELEKIGCYYNAAYEVLVMRLADDSLVFFLPRDSASASAENRDAALSACGGIDQLPLLELCLSDHGYDLNE
jgi:hypothetical protein